MLNPPKINNASKYYDLTANISSELVCFPGDPIFKDKKIAQIGKDSHFHLSEITLGNHTGTHIDFPAHVIKNGKNSSDFPIDTLLGAGVIINVPDECKSITQEFIQAQSMLPNDIVLLKTANSNISKESNFNENYVFIEPKAVSALLLKKVKIVGIDYISVDNYSAADLPVHKMLLANDVLIVECLALKHVPTGRCEIYIMPIKINRMDGLPVRVIAKIG